MTRVRESEAGDSEARADPEQRRAPATTSRERVTAPPERPLHEVVRQRGQRESQERRPRVPPRALLFEGVDPAEAERAPVPEVPGVGDLAEPDHRCGGERSRYQAARLREAGASFRGEIAEAGAGRQILLEDPSGNVIELFEYAEGGK